MAITIYDVAEKAGVSVVTVSRVLNNSPSVRKSNREKVLNAIKELDYKPNMAAQSLARGNCGLIGIMLPSVYDPFMLGTLSTIENYLKSKGRTLAVSFHSEDTNFNIENDKYMELFSQNMVDGIIILSPVNSHEYIAELKRRNLPFVLLDQHHTDIAVPTVTIDNFNGGYEATMVLIKGGAKRIGHVSGPSTYESSAERLNGYKKALSDNGIEYDPYLVLPGNFSIKSGFEAVVNWYENDIMPEAIFAADDNTAFGVIDALRKYNIKIPEEVMVIGYDNHPFSYSLHPALSTVSQPTDQLGSIGTDLLLNIIDGKITKNITITLKPEIVLRETTR